MIFSYSKLFFGERYVPPFFVILFFWPLILLMHASSAPQLHSRRSKDIIEGGLVHMEDTFNHAFWLCNRNHNMFPIETDDYPSNNFAHMKLMLGVRERVVRYAMRSTH